MAKKKALAAFLGCALSICCVRPAFAEGSGTLTFTNDGITAATEGSGYSIEGTTLTINEAGTYQLTGTCDEGAIVVGKGISGVELVLSDLNLTSSDTAPIVIKKASDVAVRLEGASTLTDAENPANEESEDADVADAFEGAAIKVKDESKVTFTGDGSLAVKGSAKNGIKGGAQAALTFESGSYDVDAENNAIASDGSLVFAGGTYDITAGDDGIKSVPEATDESSDGTVTINGGTFTIGVHSDGIQADRTLTINDGEIEIATQGGYQSTSYDPDTMSCKGLKASGDRGLDSELVINGGTISLNTADDAIHSDAHVLVNYGTLDIYSGDDAIHGDTSVTIGSAEGLTRDPEITVNASYEGIEGGSVFVYSGKTWVRAHDDGINVAGGNGGDGGEFRPGGRPGNPGDWQNEGSGYDLYVGGGDIYVDCTGDGLDANGDISLCGGRLTILSQGVGGDNSPLDANGVVLIKGATVYAAGTNPMDVRPSSDSQTCYRWSSQKSAGIVTTIKDGTTVLYSEKLPRTINYLLYTKPGLSNAPRLFVNDAFDGCKSNAWQHKWGDATPVEDADGIVSYTCSACGKIEYKTLEPQSKTTCAMYRLYNPNSGEHFYTASVVERDVLKTVGWKYEGIGWTAPVESETPVYRLYNKYAGDHHYTTNAAERDALVAAQWTDEGIGWYSDDAEGVPLYRQYNPYATTGTHNYTTSAVERDKLVSLGWKDEGIGWYGVAGSDDSGDDTDPTDPDDTIDPGDNETEISD